MIVELLNKTPIKTVIIAGRTCYDSFDKYDYISEENIGENNKKLLKYLVNKGHLSVFEHLVYTFRIEGISRLCLMELTRHRIASYSVQSTRYTLKKFLSKFYEIGDPIQAVKEFCVIPKRFTDKEIFDIFYQLETLYKYAIEEEMEIDKVKYFLPECWKTELVMTINFRSLANLFSLRLSSKAHFEIRQLSEKMLNCLNDFERSLIINACL